jgi:hypothetical protein
VSAITTTNPKQGRAKNAGGQCVFRVSRDHRHQVAAIILRPGQAGRESSCVLRTGRTHNLCGDNPEAFSRRAVRDVEWKSTRTIIRLAPVALMA